MHGLLNVKFTYLFFTTLSQNVLLCHFSRVPLFQNPSRRPDIVTELCRFFFQILQVDTGILPEFIPERFHALSNSLFVYYPIVKGLSLENLTY